MTDRLVPGSRSTLRGRCHQHQLDPWTTNCLQNANVPSRPKNFHSIVHSICGKVPSRNTASVTAHGWFQRTSSMSCSCWHRFDVHNVFRCNASRTVECVRYCCRLQHIFCILELKVLSGTKRHTIYRIQSSVTFLPICCFFIPERSSPSAHYATAPLVLTPSRTHMAAGHEHRVLTIEISYAPARSSFCTSKVSILDICMCLLIYLFLYLSICLFIVFYLCRLI